MPLLRTFLPFKNYALNHYQRSLLRMLINCYVFNLYVSSKQVFSSEQDARTTNDLFFICNNDNLL